MRTKPKPWTDQEKRYLLRGIKKLTLLQIATYLNRNEVSILNQAQRMGLSVKGKTSRSIK